MLNNFPEEQIRVLETPEITCSDIEALLDDYVDDTLLPTLKARFKEHIDGCEECQCLEKEYRLIIELAPELNAPTIPIGIRNRLRGELNKRLGLSLPQM